MPGPLRRRRTGAVVAVTGAGSGAARRCSRSWPDRRGIARVVGVDATAAPVRAGCRRPSCLVEIDVLDPGSTGTFAGVDARWCTSPSTSTPDADRAGAAAAQHPGRADRASPRPSRPACAASCVVSSALAYGAYADNPVPLADDAQLRAVPEASVVGDLLEIERIAAASRRSPPRARGDRAPARRRCSAPATGSRWRRCCPRPGCSDPRRRRPLAVLPRRRPRHRRGARRAGAAASWTAGQRRLRRLARPRGGGAGLAAGAAWSCPSGSRSARRSGCTGSASRRRRRASWRTSCIRGWSTASRLRDAGWRPPVRQRGGGRRAPGELRPQAAGGSAGRSTAAAGRGGRDGRAARHRGAGPAGPPPPLQLIGPHASVLRGTVEVGGSRPGTGPADRREDSGAETGSAAYRWRCVPVGLARDPAGGVDRRRRVGELGRAAARSVRPGGQRRGAPPLRRGAGAQPAGALPDPPDGAPPLTDRLPEFRRRN